MSHTGMPYVVFLNGPAGCGKDTIADLLCKKNGWAHLKFSAPLKAALACLLPFTPDYLTQEGKKAPVGSGGMSVREALINLSEAYAKPILGHDIFGRMLAVRLEGIKEEVAVISDSRFEEETKPIIAASDIHRLILFRIHRDGCIWAGDSGGYIYPSSHSSHFLPSFDLSNNSTPEEAAAMADRILVSKLAQHERAPGLMSG